MAADRPTSGHLNSHLNHLSLSDLTEQGQCQKSAGKTPEVLSWQHSERDVFYESAADPNGTLLFSGGGSIGLQDSHRPFHFPARTLCPGHFARGVGESQVATTNHTATRTKDLL